MSHIRALRTYERDVILLNMRTFETYELGVISDSITFVKASN